MNSLEWEAYVRKLENLPASPRVERLLKRNTAAKPRVTVHRARLVTESYKKTEGLPQVLRQAKAFEKVLAEMPIAIGPDEMIVGGLGTQPLDLILTPELRAPDIEAELDVLTTRNVEWYDISEEDKKALREQILPYWKGKSVQEIALGIANPDAKHLWLKDSKQIPPIEGGVITTEARFQKPNGLYSPSIKLAHIGLNAIKRRAKAKLKLLSPEEKARKETFYKAVIICCDAAIAHAKRYAALAKKMADEEEDSKKKSELLKVVEVCERVPENPPRTFREAVQLHWFLFFIYQIEQPGPANSFCRLDQYLYPYYTKDLEKGVITDQEALELIQNLWLKMDTIQWWKTTRQAEFLGQGRPMHVDVAGYTSHGRDATNKLTYLMIEAYDRLKTQNPNFRVLLHKDVSETLLKRICKCTANGGLPTFWNADTTVQMLVNQNVPLEEARQHGGVGCPHPQIPGKEFTYTNKGKVNLGACLEMALNNGLYRGEQLGPQTGDSKNFTDLNELLDAFAVQVEKAADALHSLHNTAIEIHKKMVPAPFGSSLFEDCIERGLTMQEGGTHYVCNGYVGLIGISDIIDSFVAIKKFVYDEKTLTIDQLKDALNKNFEGAEVLRQMLINKAPKWGNDNDYADVVGREIISRLTSIGCKEKYDNLPIKHNLKSRGVTFVGYTGGITFGKIVGALPSGRKAGEPLVESISPVHGCDRNGPTAILKSVSKFDHASCRSPSVLNLWFTRSAVEDVGDLVSFLRAFVALGVAHIQFNIVSRDTLLEAQKHPEEYGTLIVRVAGYNARFTSLSKEVQDDIISRTEYGNTSY